MKKAKHLAIAASVLAVGLSATAAKADPGFYGDVRAGLAEVDTMHFTDPASANLTVYAKTGWALTGAVGYRFSDSLRIETTAGYQRSKIGGSFSENVQILVPCGTFANQPCLDPGVKGSLEVPTLFAMGYYDIPITERLGLSVGAGIGAAWVNLDAHTTGRLNDGTSARFTMVTDTDTVFAGRAAVDLTYKAGPVDAVLGYSYTRSSHVSLAGRGVYTSFNYNPRLSSHMITVGARLAF